MSTAADLRSRAEGLAGPLPPLLAEARHLATTVILGEHGRRRAGMGDAFWQYRPAQPTDSTRRIDWRRSARTDQHFVQEKEWQIAQSVMMWVDRSAAMTFASKGMAPKVDRARVLALALSILLLRGGERVGLSGTDVPARSGQRQIDMIAEVLTDDHGDDYGSPDTRGMKPRSCAVFISDFMGDLGAVEAALAKAADRGVTGVLAQVLDPQEESFPFDGRTIFESMSGTLRHETLKAGELRDRYIDRLAERKDRLESLARQAGWRYSRHLTSDSAASALLWLYGATGRQS